MSIDVEALMVAVFNADQPGDWPKWDDYIAAFGSPGTPPWRRKAEAIAAEYARLVPAEDERPIDYLAEKDRSAAEHSDTRSACPRCGEWRDSPTSDCAACGFVPAEDEGRLSVIRHRHETHDDPETCDAECLELPEVMDAFTAQNDAEDEGRLREALDRAWLKSPDARGQPRPADLGDYLVREYAKPR